MDAIRTDRPEGDARLAARFRAVRRAAGLSADEMAARLGMSLRTYRSAEAHGAVAYKPAWWLALAELERQLAADAQSSGEP